MMYVNLPHITRPRPQASTAPLEWARQKGFVPTGYSGKVFTIGAVGFEIVLECLGAAFGMMKAFAQPETAAISEDFGVDHLVILEAGDGFRTHHIQPQIVQGLQKLLGYEQEDAVGLLVHWLEGEP